MAIDVGQTLPNVWLILFVATVSVSCGGQGQSGLNNAQLSTDMLQVYHAVRSSDTVQY